MRFIVPSLLVFATRFTAAGNAIVLNNLTNPIYAWSVGSSIGARQKLVSGGLYMEPLHRDEKTGRIAIKITNGVDGLYNGEPQQVFAYNLDGGQVCYDLSTVFGEPFVGHRVEVTSDSGGPIVWPTGTHPGGSRAGVVPSGEKVWFTVYGTN